MDEKLVDYVINGEQVLPEAAASVNMRIDWNGADLQLTLRDFNENDLLARLVQIKPALEELGMTLKNGGDATKSKSIEKARIKPATEEPDVVDEIEIEVKSIYVHEGNKGNMAYVKGSPGFEKDGAKAFDAAFKPHYDLQELEAGKFYKANELGFVRAVIRDGKVWRLLTEHEQIAF